jgi:predicted GIY-YIG superfamily endonuclease
MYCVYKITNKLNGKFYIGITSKSVRRRWSDVQIR